MRRLAVAGLALLLVAVAAWLVVRRDYRNERAERARARLMQFDVRRVSGLEIRSDDLVWRFELRAGDWKLVAPVEDHASAGAIQQLLAIAQTTRVQEVIEEPEALAAYGLDPPRHTLRIVGPEVGALDLGENSPLGDATFARIEGRDEVLVLGVLEAGSLGVSPQRLRDRNLTGLLANEIVSVDLRRGDRHVRLEREDSTWWMTEPTRLPASEAAVDRMLGALEKSEAVGFLDGVDTEDARFGLDSPKTLRVSLHTAEFSREVRLGAPVSEEGRFAHRSDRLPVLVVPAEFLEAVTVDEHALATEKLTPFNRYRVTGFDYRVGAETLRAGRDEEQGWRTESGRALEEPDVLALLARLLEAPVADWDVQETPPGEPAASLEFTLEGGESARIDYYDGKRARVASLPHVTFRVASAPPTIPASLRGD